MRVGGGGGRRVSSTPPSCSAIRSQDLFTGVKYVLGFPDASSVIYTTLSSGEN